MDSSSRVFLKANWRNLAMLNYEVDPSLLLKFTPAGTEIDRWSGKVFVSLVGFRFLNTKVFGISIPFHRNFDEVNLRFYVRRRKGNETRRGVVFIKEIVPRWAIAAVARIVYNENYAALPMSHKIQPNGNADLAAEYAWRSRSGWNHLNLTVTGNPALPQDGSEEQFITEHYWGYARQRDGGCVEYRVAHEPWRVWSSAAANFKGHLEEVYGRDLAEALAPAPASAFLAEGSEVTVYRGTRL
jgi:uncharacterized protein YqjF (DUF2071 family)